MEVELEAVVVNVAAEPVGIDVMPEYGESVLVRLPPWFKLDGLAEPVNALVCISSLDAKIRYVSLAAATVISSPDEKDNVCVESCKVKVYTTNAVVDSEAGRDVAATGLANGPIREVVEAAMSVESVADPEVTDNWSGERKTSVVG